MAKKKIRECDGKRILKANAARLTKMKFEQLRPVMVTAETDWKKLRQQEPWMLETKLVAKPDMMFGKRGKHDLVLLNATLDEVKTFVQERVGKVMTIGAVTGTITHFLVEPFIPHDVEYYFSIVSERESTHIYFSLEGGIDIESGWENKVRSVSIPVGQTLDDISEVCLLLALLVLKK
jgi:succinyl-CoA synthetase beta subunit